MLSTATMWALMVDATANVRQLTYKPSTYVGYQSLFREMDFPIFHSNWDRDNHYSIQSSLTEALSTDITTSCTYTDFYLAAESAWSMSALNKSI